MRVNPSAVWINVQIGHCLKELGDYPAARAAYMIFLELNQTDADIHLQMGHLCMRADAFDEAETWYLKAASLASPDDAVARDAALGVAAAGEGPIRRRRDDALALTDAGRFHDAYDRVRELVETDGQEDLVGILGNVCKEIRRLKEAASAYQRYPALSRRRADSRPSVRRGPSVGAPCSADGRSGGSAVVFPPGAAALSRLRASELHQGRTAKGREQSDRRPLQRAVDPRGDLNSAWECRLVARAILQSITLAAGCSVALVCVARAAEDLNASRGDFQDDPTCAVDQTQKLRDAVAWAAGGSLTLPSGTICLKKSELLYDHRRCAQ